MDTRERIKKYIELTGAEIKAFAEASGYSRTTISRWLSDKDDYIPCQEVVEKCEETLNRILEELKSI